MVTQIHSEGVCREPNSMLWSVVSGQFWWAAVNG